MGGVSTQLRSSPAGSGRRYLDRFTTSSDAVERGVTVVWSLGSSTSRRGRISVNRPRMISQSLPCRQLGFVGESRLHAVGYEAIISCSFVFTDSADVWRGCG
jgi:hypothetical protein